VGRVVVKNNPGLEVSARLETRRRNFCDAMRVGVCILASLLSIQSSAGLVSYMQVAPLRPESVGA
jgi:hypothetical protein